jgi:hypothetical protein
VGRVGVGGETGPGFELDGRAEFGKEVEEYDEEEADFFFRFFFCLTVLGMAGATLGVVLNVEPFVDFMEVPVEVIGLNVSTEDEGGDDGD